MSNGKIAVFRGNTGIFFYTQTSRNFSCSDFQTFHDRSAREKREISHGAAIPCKSAQLLYMPMAGHRADRQFFFKRRGFLLKTWITNQVIPPGGQDPFSIRLHKGCKIHWEQVSQSWYICEFLFSFHV